MIDINLEFLSWLSEIMGSQGTHNSAKCKQIVEEGSMVKDLLKKIAAGNPRFGQMVFDVDHEKLNETVCILINTRQLELVNGLETRLKTGDSLVFVPVIQGG